MIEISEGLLYALIYLSINLFIALGTGFNRFEDSGGKDLDLSVFSGYQVAFYEDSRQRMIEPRHFAVG